MKTVDRISIVGEILIFPVRVTVFLFVLLPYIVLLYGFAMLSDRLKWQTGERIGCWVLDNHIKKLCNFVEIEEP